MQQHKPSSKCTATGTATPDCMHALNSLKITALLYVEGVLI